MRPTQPVRARFVVGKREFGCFHRFNPGTIGEAQKAGGEAFGRIAILSSCHRPEVGNVKLFALFKIVRPKGDVVDAHDGKAEA